MGTAWVTLVLVVLLCPNKSTQVPLPVTCDFESPDLCSFSLSASAHFVWHWNSGSSPTVGSGPRQARHGTYYVYTEASDPSKQDDRAFINTPPIDYGGTACVDFYYHMHGSAIGSLQLLTSTRGAGQPWWRKDGHQGDQWNLAQVQITLHPQDTVQFVGVRGQDIYGDIALDLVNIRVGGCNPLPLRCGFEQDLCGLIQLNEDNFDWTRLSGPTETANTGPNNADRGQYYIYAEGSAPRLPWDRAIFETPRFDVEGQICIHFRYHMYGDSHMGALEVTLTATRPREIIFTKYGNQGNTWHTADINTRLQIGDKISFTSIRGKGSEPTNPDTGLSDIALDDLDIFRGDCADRVPAEGTQLPGDITDDNIDELIPGSTYTCDLERRAYTSDDCYLLQDSDDDFDWLQRQGKTPSGNIQRAIRGGFVPVTGPLEAKDGTKYAYIETTGAPAGWQSRLFLYGAMFEQGGLSCLTFDYNMNGFHCGELLIFVEYVHQDRKTLWQMEGDKYEKWHGAALDVSMDGVTKIGMQATAKGYFNGDIAIDNVQLFTGSCTLIPTSDLWVCNFETAEGDLTWCRMEQDLTDTSNFDWEANTGQTPSKLTGPSNAYNGNYYIFIETSAPRRDGDFATVLVPTLSYTGSVCVSFWYHMYGYHISKLSIILRLPGQPDETVWSATGEQGDYWSQQQITVNDYDPLKQIGFSARRGAEYSGDIAIDSIELLPCACPGPC